MRVGVVNEVSARARNDVLMRAVQATGNVCVNLGMSVSGEEPELTYIHTGLMAALAIELDIVDFVVGGCGTGQGFLNSVMAYPGIVCGHIRSPLDAVLFTRINAGNCISLALNQGFGWGSELDIELTVRALLSTPRGSGYPAERSAPQAESREHLKAVSAATHRELGEILGRLAPAIVDRATRFPRFRSAVRSCPQAASQLARAVLAEPFDRD